jgi:hypothetical protein
MRKSSYDAVEFQAGYDARFNDVPHAISATRSWRAGWCDADATKQGTAYPSMEEVCSAT